MLLYQKKLPILTENSNENGFCVNARDLWNQLDCPQGKFMNWVKRKFEPYGFSENIDFKASQNCESLNTGIPGMDKPKDFMLTIDMAKQLAMIDKKESGFIARRYFILMEDLIKRNDNWWRVRKPQKENYKPMCEALSSSIHKATGRSADDYDYKFEANRLNVIATGSTAQAIKLYLGMQPNELTRDGLETDYNEKIAFLQEQNMLLLGMNMSLIDRVKMLITMFDIKYPTASPIMSYLCRDDLIKARIHMIEKLENK